MIYIKIKVYILIVLMSACIELPDVETASDNYRKRFIGKIGEWILLKQRLALIKLLNKWKEGKILDVGGGHGFYTESLINLGYRVTVLASAESAVGKEIFRLCSTNKVDFVIGDLYSKYPFNKNSFDIVISFRLMTHTKDCSKLILPMLEIEPKTIIFDFSPLESLNMFVYFLFDLKKRIENMTTRFFYVHSLKVIRKILNDNGWDITGIEKEFFLPVAFHRLVNNYWVSLCLEKIFQYTGLTRLLGAPAVVRAECKSNARFII